ncbi:MAG: prolyl oligopeptidase family serine peptidase [Clostridia bacterium]|nr:prolyl oligopeptidase family serine peptidase [Clostridia bacterium]
MKKLLSLFMAVVILTLSCIGVTAISLNDGLDALKAQFLPGEGPAVNGYSVDYRYFSPVKQSDSTKYPIVIWLHGLGEGGEEGAQIKKNNIAYWASDEFQSRFAPAGGAFIIAARSREEMGITWENCTIEPLRAAIDDFIAKNSKNVDLSRIYIGGFSMGGKMTLKMAVAYPEMFAAAFPICPAWSPDTQATEYLADMPIWLTSGKLDPLVNYNLAVTPTWKSIVASSNVPEECRFSTLSTVRYPDGKRTSSSHHAWFAVNYDMFAIDNGAYPDMTTVNGLGEEVTLTYPKGMISWLTAHTSDFDGSAGIGMGNLEKIEQTDSMITADSIASFIQSLIDIISQFISNLFNPLPQGGC